MCTVVRKGEGISIERVKAYKYQHLAYTFRNKKAEPFLVTVEPAPESEKPVLHEHSGQEFNLVLEGSIAVVFDDKELVLTAGDSIYFNPTHPHGQRCVGTVKARFLTVIAE